MTVAAVKLNLFDFTFCGTGGMTAMNGVPVKRANQFPEIAVGSDTRLVIGVPSLIQPLQ